MENVLQVVAMFNAIRFPLWIGEKAEFSDIREFVVVNGNEVVDAMDEYMLTEAGERITKEMNQSIYGFNVDRVKR